MNSGPLPTASVLAAIRDLTEQLGRPPLNRELMHVLSTRSVSALSKALDRLEARGAIERRPLRVTTKGAPKCP